jgi:hypothetical protein
MNHIKILGVTCLLNLPTAIACEVLEVDAQ